MNRRNFLGQASLSLPFTAAFLAPIISSAQECTDWIEVPGTAGRLLIKNLFSAGKAQCRLYKMAPGFQVAAHIHPAGEYTYLIDGTFESEEGVFVKGDAVYKEPGSTHPMGESGPAGAIVFVFTPEPIIKIL